MPEESLPGWEDERRGEWRQEVQLASRLSELVDHFEEMCMYVDRWFLSKWWSPWENLKVRKEEKRKKEAAAALAEAVRCGDVDPDQEKRERRRKEEDKPAAEPQP
jgi:hypothetical protein